MKAKVKAKAKAKVVHLVPTALNLLDYMRENGSITGLEAVRECGVIDYRKRISELRAAGFNIVDEYESGVNRNGAVVRYKRYRFEEAQA